MELNQKDVKELINNLRSISRSIGNFSKNIEKQEFSDFIKSDDKKNDDKQNSKLSEFRSGLTREYNFLSSITNRFALNLTTAAVAGQLFGIALNTLHNTTIELYKTYNDLSQSGLTFGGSLLQLGYAASNAGLSIQDFANLVKDNSTLVNTIGIEKFSNSLRDLTTRNNGLSLLGLSSTEMSDVFVTYTDMLRRSMSDEQFRNITQDQLTQNTIEFGRSLMTVSAVTGKSFKDLQNKIKDLNKSGVFRASLSSLPESIRETVTKGLAGLPDDAGNLMVEYVQSVASGFGGVTSELGKMLPTAGSFGNEISNLTSMLTNGQISSSEFNRRLGSASRSLFANDKAQLEMLKTLANSEGPHKAAATALLNMAHSAAQMTNVTDIETLERHKLNESFSELNTAFTKFKSSIGTLVTSFIDFLSPAIISVTNLLTPFITSISNGIISLSSLFTDSTWIKDNPILSWSVIAGGSLALLVSGIYVAIKSFSIFSSMLSKLIPSPSKAVDEQMLYKGMFKALREFENPGTLKTSTYKMGGGFKDQLTSAFKNALNSSRNFNDRGNNTRNRNTRNITNNRTSGKMMGLASNIGTGIASIGLGVGSTLTSIGGMFSGVGKVAGAFAKVALGGSKFIPIVGQVIAGAMALYDGINGWNNASEILNIDPDKLTFTDKLSAAVGGVVGGIASIGDGIASLFGFETNFQDDVTKYTAHLTKNIFDGTKNLLSSTGNWIQEKYNSITSFDFSGTISNISSAVYDGAKNLLSSIGNLITGIFSENGISLSKIASSVAEFIPQAVSQIVNYFKDLIVGMPGRLLSSGADFVSGAIGKVTNFFSSSNNSTPVQTPSVSQNNQNPQRIVLPNTRANIPTPVATPTNFNLTELSEILKSQNQIIAANQESNKILIEKYNDMHLSFKTMIDRLVEIRDLNGQQFKDMATSLSTLVDNTRKNNI